MDKETLSNYGWIVICVLVLSVMIALATPFGTFVSGAVESTAQGLFDTNYQAVDIAGIVVNYQSFEDIYGGAGNNETLKKNNYGFYFDTPYRGAFSENGETIFAELVFSENGTIYMNTYSDMYYTTLVDSQSANIVDWSENGYADLPIMDGEDCLLEFSPDGSSCVLWGAITFNVVGNYEKPAPVLNQYGFYFNAEYALTDRCFIGDYLTYEFREDTSVVVRWYADSNYTVALQTIVANPGGYEYGNGYIHSTNSFEYAAYESITFCNNGRMLRCSDIDLSYNSMLLDDYRALIKGVTNPVVFAAGEQAFVGVAGMTWNDFVNSAYNRNGYFYIENNVVYSRDGQIYNSRIVGVDGITRPGDIEGTSEIRLETYSIWR